MRIDAYIGNPVITTQQDYYDLEELLQEIEPDCEPIQLRPERLIVTNIARRTFHYPRHPSVGWVADRLRNMVKNGL